MSNTIEKQATEIWATFDDNEKFGVKFGLFPANKMPKESNVNDGRLLAVALMDLGSK